MPQLSTRFEQQDLVWAKIQHYPWWPGKIVQIFEQKKSLIFKIRFYADPTYCYLKQDALVSFKQFQPQMNAHFQIDGQLQKAIVLANNAFQKNKRTFQNPTFTEQQFNLSPPSLLDSQSNIFQQQPSKPEQFQQSTIHIDFQAQISNKKNSKNKNETQIKNLLLKYRLDKIPSFAKQIKSLIQKESQLQAESSETISQVEEKVQQIDLKNNHRKKNIRKVSKPKSVIKKKRINSLSDQETKVQLIRRVCYLLISKGFDAQISREITVKIIEKTEQVFQKQKNSLVQKINTQTVYVKLINIIMAISPTTSYDDKLLEVFTSIDRFLFGHSQREKEEEQKTNINCMQEQGIEA